VRVAESACPFCGSLLEETLRATPPPRVLAGRLSRAALYTLGTLGAGTVSLAAACSQANSVPYGSPPPIDSGMVHDSTTTDTASGLDSSSQDAGKGD
jgi:hypothetical protein